MGDDLVRGGEDLGCGAVVLLELEGRDALEFAGELLDVLDARATPAIDGLVVVAHHEEPPPVSRKERDPCVLKGVGVLELVHEQVREPLLVLGEQVGLLAQHLPRPEQELGEVDEPARRARRLVGPVHLGHPPFPEVARLGEMAGAHPVLLLAVDEPLGLLGRPAPLVEVHLPHEPPHEAELVVAVGDLERLPEPRLLPVGAEEPVGDAVEGADPHPPDGALEDRLDARPHLARRLVGEGDGEDPGGTRLPGGDEPGDAVGEHPGLPASRAGEHQRVAGLGGHRGALLVVERLDDVRDVVHASPVRASRPFYRPAGREADRTES